MRDIWGSVVSTAFEILTAATIFISTRSLCIDRAISLFISQDFNWNSQGISSPSIELETVKLTSYQVVLNCYHSSKIFQYFHFEVVEVHYQGKECAYLQENNAMIAKKNSTSGKI